MSNRIRYFFDAVGVTKLLDSFKKAGGGMKGLKAALVALPAAAAAAGAAVGAAMVEIAAKVAETGDRFAKLGQRTGATATEISELAFAAERSGAKFEQMALALRTVNRKAAEAARGNEVAAKSFDDIGVSVKNADGSLKSSVQLTEEIAGAISELGSENEKAAAAFKIFEASGVDILPLLRSGADGIQELRGEAKALGASFSEDLARDSEKFQDQLTNTKAALSGIGITIASAVLPILNKLLEWLVQGIVNVRQWAEANKGAFQAFGEAVRGAVLKAIDLFAQLREWQFNVLEALTGGVAKVAAFFGKDLSFMQEAVAEFRAKSESDINGVRSFFAEMGKDSGELREDVVGDNDAMAESYRQLASSAKMVARPAIKELSQEIIDYEIEASRAEGATEGIYDEFVRVEDPTKKAGTAARDYADALKGLVDQLGLADTFLGDFITTMERAAAINDSLSTLGLGVDVGGLLGFGKGGGGGGGGAGALGGLGKIGSLFGGGGGAASGGSHGAAIAEFNALAFPTPAPSGGGFSASGALSGAGQALAPAGATIAAYKGLSFLDSLGSGPSYAELYAEDVASARQRQQARYDLALDRRRESYSNPFQASGAWSPSDGGTVILNRGVIVNDKTTQAKTGRYVGEAQAAADRTKIT